MWPNHFPGRQWGVRGHWYSALSSSADLVGSGTSSQYSVLASVSSVDDLCQYSSSEQLYVPPRLYGALLSVIGEHATTIANARFYVSQLSSSDSASDATCSNSAVWTSGIVYATGLRGSPRLDLSSPSDHPARIRRHHFRISAGDGSNGGCIRAIIVHSFRYSPPGTCPHRASRQYSSYRLWQSSASSVSAARNWSASKSTSSTTAFEMDSINRTNCPTVDTFRT